LGAAALAAVVVGVSVAAYPVATRHLGPGDSSTKKIKKTEDVSGRLTSFGPTDDRRIEYWKVAWEEWKKHPLTGTGAGTFMYTWQENRPDFSSVKQVHNVYLEQGTETGGFAFLALVGFAAFLLLHALRAAWKASGERRVVLSGLLAAVVVYLISSGLEWHWYIPPSTIFFFLLAGAAAKFASKPEWEVSGEASVRQGKEYSGA
jgi:O-antigen ligase